MYYSYTDVTSCEYLFIIIIITNIVSFLSLFTSLLIANYTIAENIKHAYLFT